MTHMTWSSVDRMASFDAFAGISLIRQPVLMVVGREAVTAWMSIEAYRGITGPKQLVWIEGAGHVDLYDRYAEQVVEQVSGFFDVRL